MIHKVDANSGQQRFDRRTALKVAGGALLTANVAQTSLAAGGLQAPSLPDEEYTRHDALGLAELVAEFQRDLDVILTPTLGT